MGVQVRKDCQMAHSVRRPSVGVPKLFCFPLLEEIQDRCGSWVLVYPIGLTFIMLNFLGADQGLTKV